MTIADGIVLTIFLVICFLLLRYMGKRKAKSRRGENCSGCGGCSCSSCSSMKKEE